MKKKSVKKNSFSVDTSSEQNVSPSRSFPQNHSVLVLLICAVIVIALGFLAFNVHSLFPSPIGIADRIQAQSSSSDSPQSESSTPLEISLTDRERGTNPSGTVTVVEFVDFQCPYCLNAVPVIKQIISTDRVNFIIKHFPLAQIHPYAQKAAEAAECARDQDQFFEYHDALFAQQYDLSLGALKTIAAGLGLDTTRFNSCLDSGEKAALVQQDFNEGVARGVRGTPTFFINQQSIVGSQSFSLFQQAIDRELSS